MATAILFAAPIANATTGGEVIARFDSQVASGLPATIPLPAGTSRARRHADANGLTIETKIDASVTLPGGIAASTYRGMLDGKVAIVTRASDHLDIALPGQNRVEITGFSGESDDIEHIVFADPKGTDETADDGTVPEPPAVAPARVARSVAQTEQTRRRQLDIHFFVHEDLERQVNATHIHVGYVSWWLADMHESVAPFASIDMRYHLSVPGLTNVKYREAKLRSDWPPAVRIWAAKRNLSFEGTHLNKFVLLTARKPYRHLVTSEWDNENAAMVSLDGRYRVVAHELGHLLGASHADSEVRFTGRWWCESNMYDGTLAIRSNCYTYSAANARRIRAYLIEGPRADAPRLPEHPVFE